MTKMRWRIEAAAPPDQLLSLDAIRTEVERIARRLGSPPDMMRLDFGRSHDDGTPHVEVGDGYHYVTCERGQELRRRTTFDLDSLLYWIATDMTRSIALTREAAARRRHEDSRRQWFGIWRQQIASLDAEWASRLDYEISAILEKHPFVDQ